LSQLGPDRAGSPEKKYSRAGFRVVLVPQRQSIAAARLAVASYFIVGMIGVLLIGFWKLQVIDADKYSTMAERTACVTFP